MTQVTQPLVEVENLVKHFSQQSGLGGGKGVVRAVENVSFCIGNGETLGLVGESGSGKSTTGRLMLRLIEPTEGICRFGGKNVFLLSKPEMRALRREMQIVFQDPYGAFNPRMTIGRIIGEALELRGVNGSSARAAEVSRLLELVQLPPEVRGRYPHEFSGGQRQRIGIARALAVEPRFLVADEPVSALDVSTQAEIVNLLLDLQKRLGLTMLFISHDLSVVRVMADRIAVMFCGPHFGNGLLCLPLSKPSAAIHTGTARGDPRTGPSAGASWAAKAIRADGGRHGGRRCCRWLSVCRTVPAHDGSLSPNDAAAGGLRPTAGRD